MKFKALLTALTTALLAATSVSAIPITQFDGFDIRDGEVGMKTTKMEFKSSGGTGVHTVKPTDSSNTNRTLTLPDATDTLVGKATTDTLTNKTLTAPTITGATLTTTTLTSPTINGATLSGTLAGTPTLSGANFITAANIQSGSAKRQLIRFQLSPVTGDAADSTVYRGYAVPGRACTVKRLTASCQIAPTVGTDTIKVLKASSSGNTMLNAATFDANGLTAFVGSNLTLTATGADLGLTATQGIYCEYSAGSQTVDARDVEIEAEVEFDDF